MGCSSSKDIKQTVMRMQQQEKKIDDLIQMNQALQHKLSEIQQVSTGSEAKQSVETNDLTNLLDARFTKIEKTVEKIHNEFRHKLFDKVDGNQDPEEEAIKVNKSLSLNFGAETDMPKIDKGVEDHHWKDLLDESYFTCRGGNNEATTPRHQGIPSIYYSNYGKTMKTLQNNHGVMDHNDLYLEVNDRRF